VKLVARAPKFDILSRDILSTKADRIFPLERIVVKRLGLLRSRREGRGRPSKFVQWTAKLGIRGGVRIHTLFHPAAYQLSYLIT